MKRCEYCRNKWPATRERCQSCGAPLPEPTSVPFWGGSYRGGGGGPSVGPGYAALMQAQQNAALGGQQWAHDQLRNMNPFEVK